MGHEPEGGLILQIYLEVGFTVNADCQPPGQEAGYMVLAAGALSVYLSGINQVRLCLSQLPAQKGQDRISRGLMAYAVWLMRSGFFPRDGD